MRVLFFDVRADPFFCEHFQERRDLLAGHRCPFRIKADNNAMCGLTLSSFRIKADNDAMCGLTLSSYFS
jgi:hypothetical protein